MNKIKVDKKTLEEVGRLNIMLERCHKRSFIIWCLQELKKLDDRDYRSKAIRILLRQQGIPIS